MNNPSAATYDAVVVVSFGGPDKREDVIPRQRQQMGADSVQ